MVDRGGGLLWCSGCQFWNQVVGIWGGVFWWGLCVGIDQVGGCVSRFRGTCGGVVWCVVLVWVVEGGVGKGARTEIGRSWGDVGECCLGGLVLVSGFVGNWWGVCGRRGKGIKNCGVCCCDM